MCITGACPPYYYGTGRVARQVFGWSTDLQKQIESSDKKPLDKPTSLNQNPIMCKTLKFQTAVIVAIRASLSPNKTVFSSYDVTQKLREQVNSNEIAFSDKTPEDINGNTTFRVEAEDVKEVIQDFYNGGLLTRTNNGRYFEYSVAPFNTVASSVRAASPQTTPTLPPLAAYVPKAVSQSSTPSPTSALAKISNVVQLVDTNKLTAYLSGRGRNSVVSMKQIQSRFDQAKGVTCGAYALHLESLGYRVNKPSTKTSEWTITVQ